MIVVVDEREAVVRAYEASFGREGLAAAGFGMADFRGWLGSASRSDLDAAEAILIGDGPDRERLPAAARERTKAPVIALVEIAGLDTTLRLFAAGADDVVRKPVHVREIVARIAAIKRRQAGDPKPAAEGDLRVYFDGRDPEVNGRTLALPRRERRILELLAANPSRRITKAQIFSSIYGLFDEEVEENVVESHICKLRKKLKRCLGYDPIDSKRYLGYQLQIGRCGPAAATPEDYAALAQAV
jgi:two-component system, OmpR family, flagellar system response regulator FtcR